MSDWRRLEKTTFVVFYLILKLLMRLEN